MLSTSTDATALRLLGALHRRLARRRSRCRCPASSSGSRGERGRPFVAIFVLATGVAVVGVLTASRTPLLEADPAARAGTRRRERARLHRPSRRARESYADHAGAPGRGPSTPGGRGRPSAASQDRPGRAPARTGPPRRPRRGRGDLARGDRPASSRGTTEKRPPREPWRRIGELVELRRAEHAPRHRRRGHQPLLRALAGVVAGVDVVDADDRQRDVVTHSGAGPAARRCSVTPPKNASAALRFWVPMLVTSTTTASASTSRVGEARSGRRGRRPPTGRARRPRARAGGPPRRRSARRRRCRRPPPASSGRQPRAGPSRVGHVGEDLHVVLVLEAERQREGHLVDLAERGVGVQPLGDLRRRCRPGPGRTAAGPGPAESRCAAAATRRRPRTCALVGGGASRWG